MLNGTNVYLIGMMGAGKSTVGKLLAKKLQYHFFDTDTLVEQCTKMSVAEIFSIEGESAFRQIEHQVLAEVSAYKSLAIATGGGIVMDQMNWSYLRHGLVVWLNVPIDLLYQRLLTSTIKRPLLQAENPRAILTDIYNQRRDRYAQSDLQITVNPSDSAQTVCDRLFSLIVDRIEPDRLTKPQNRD